MHVSCLLLFLQAKYKISLRKRWRAPLAVQDGGIILQYRKYGKTGFEVSALGLGCMRLPFKDPNDGSKGVDREKAYELIRYAADNGVNYFDTAFGYHARDSEAVLGEALEEGGRRKKVKITTKQPFAQMTTQADIRRNLENTLKKLRSDYVDFYLMHGIGTANWSGILERDIFAEFEKFKEEGLIKHIGFSYHGNYELFKEVVERFPWDMCLVQQNMLDIEREVTVEGLYTAYKNDVAIAIMEPLRGGGLAYAPKPVAELYNNFPTKRTAAEWAFRHLINYKEVGTIVSGMSTLEQLKENIAIFSKADMVEGCLSAEEKMLIESARNAYNSIAAINCTSCGYCIPCPQNVDIPGVLSRYNDGHRFEHFDQPRRSYMFTRRGKRSALECSSCGMCIDKCPQGLDIPKELQIAHKALDGWEE